MAGDGSGEKYKPQPWRPAKGYAEDDYRRVNGQMRLLPSAKRGQRPKAAAGKSGRRRLPKPPARK